MERPLLEVPPTNGATTPASPDNGAANLPLPPPPPPPPAPPSLHPANPELAGPSLSLPLDPQGLQQQLAAGAAMHPFHPGYVPPTIAPAIAPPQYQFDPLAAMAQQLSASTTTSFVTPIPGMRCAQRPHSEHANIHLILPILCNVKVC